MPSVPAAYGMQLTIGKGRGWGRALEDFRFWEAGARLTRKIWHVLQRVKLKPTSEGILRREAHVLLRSQNGGLDSLKEGHNTCRKDRAILVHGD